MDVATVLAGLNPTQQAVVSAPQGNMLVLAGAGTGKTRVLVQRIAWLLSVEKELPTAILAVTFSNKAAAQIRQRIDALLGVAQHRLWVGTFHGLAHRLLRTHPIEAGLPRDFQILDTEDQLRLLKRLIRALNLDDKRWSPRQAASYINAKKDEGIRAEGLESATAPAEATWLRIYQTYQEACNRAGLVDFAELLLRAYELWQQQPLLLTHYQYRFKHILVDEFQDTNAIQYAWIQRLAGQHSRVVIVGDDDQSIYGWRGAQVENIQRFLDDFSSVTTFRLEQNYRSSGNILQAANTLIACNADRLGKNLWTEGQPGDPIALHYANDELAEARFVAGQIKRWQAAGQPLNHCAVLYRSNAQSRVLEETLLQARLPYHIYGGMRFFERQEIKDVLAYLRLMANRHDDAAFERVVNTPARGIGERTLATLRQAAREQEQTLWQASIDLMQQGILAGRAAAALQRFLALIDALAQETVNLSLQQQTDRVMRDSGLWGLYQQERGESGQTRLENLAELITATGQFNVDHDLEGVASPLQAFLSHTMLETSARGGDLNQDAVQMMTLHSAKGLEFPQVFIVGMEEGLFPSQQSLNRAERLEEERRLAYVGVTRAMRQLTLSYAGSRRIYGEVLYHQPSRFILELPAQCLNTVYSTMTSFSASHGQYTSPLKAQIKGSDSPFNLGQRVVHPKFGAGTVINLEGQGEHSRVQVAFQQQGVKWLVTAYARLEHVN